MDDSWKHDARANLGGYLRDVDGSIVTAVPEDYRIKEGNNELANECLRELINAVRKHKNSLAVPCAPYCPGNVFNDWVTQQLATKPELVRYVLRNAVTRLAGFDVD